MFAVPPREVERNMRTFQQKYLNIMDPLKENNNLGRSVHRGSFFRICGAFRYGARTLGQILSLPRDKIACEITKFFSNTLRRHAQKLAANIQNCRPTSGAESFDKLSLSSPGKVFPKEGMLVNSLGALSGNVYSNNLATANSPSLRAAIGTVAGSTIYSFPRPSNAENKFGYGNLSPHQHDYIEYVYCNFVEPYAYRGACMVPGGDAVGPEAQRFTEDFGLASFLDFGTNLVETNNACWIHKDTCSSASAVSSREMNSPGLRGSSSSSVAEDNEDLNPLIDLTGEYESHVRNLLYARFGSASSPSLVYEPAPYQSGNRNFVDTVPQFIPFGQHSFSQPNTNHVFAGPYYAHSDSAQVSAGFISHGRPKGQGTGAYLPKMVGSFRERPPRDTGRNRIRGNDGLPQDIPCTYGSSHTFSPTKSSEDGDGSYTLPSRKGSYNMHAGSSAYGHGRSFSHDKVTHDQSSAQEHGRSYVSHEQVMHGGSSAQGYGRSHVCYDQVMHARERGKSYVSHGQVMNAGSPAQGRGRSSVPHQSEFSSERDGQVSNLPSSVKKTELASLGHRIATTSNTSHAGGSTQKISHDAHSSKPAQSSYKERVLEQVASSIYESEFPPLGPRKDGRLVPKPQKRNNR